jgi:uncharacterized membrane protein
MEEKDSKFKDIVEKSKENIKQAKGKVIDSLENEGNENIYASLSYLPVLGTIIVYLFKKEIKFVMGHAKNSLFNQLLFGIVLFVIWFLINMPLISTILKATLFIPVMTSAIMYIDIIFIIASSIYGAIKAYNLKTWETPYIYVFFNKYSKKAFVNRKKS